LLGSDAIDITVITSGKSLFIDEVKKKIQDLQQMTKEERYNFWVNEAQDTDPAGIIPKKLFFGKDIVYSKKNMKINKNIEFDISHSIGGLSNVWGANVTDISKNDKSKFNDGLADLEKYLIKVTEKFKIAGEYDDIDDGKNTLKYYSKKLNYCCQAHYIYKKYKENSNFFFKKNIRIGLAKLAIKTEGNDNTCENCGMCMLGCHKNSIFNSENYFNKIKNINFFDNSIVENIDEKDNKTFLKITKNNNSTIEYFDYTFVASGPINTSKLVLKFLNKYNKKSLIIKDSQKYFFLYYVNKNSKRNEEITTTGLSQLFLQTEISKNTFHLQLYHSKILLDLVLKKFKKSKILNLTKKIINFFIKRIMIGVVYFPSEVSDSIVINYEKEKNIFSIFKYKNTKFSNLLIIRILARIFSSSLKLFSFPLPIFIKSKTGISQHFGSCLPMKKKPVIGECSMDGKLFGSENIYIVDASNLPRIPSTPTTFLTMANAYRISENFLKNLKK